MSGRNNEKESRSWGAVVNSVIILLLFVPLFLSTISLASALNSRLNWPSSSCECFAAENKMWVLFPWQPSRFIDEFRCLMSANLFHCGLVNCKIVSCSLCLSRTKRIGTEGTERPFDLFDSPFLEREEQGTLKDKRRMMTGGDLRHGTEGRRQLIKLNQDLGAYSIK